MLNKNKVNVRLGDLLVELGYLRESDLQQALGMHRDSQGKKRLGEILVEGGFIEERRLLETLSYQLGYPLLELDFVKLDRTLLNTIPLNICRENSLVPVTREGNQVLVAFSDPLDQRARNMTERYLGRDFKSSISSAESVREALNALERSAAPASLSDENTIIGMINTLFEEAIEEGASDIHIEPMKDRLRVRFRRDGVMDQHKDFPKEIAPQLCTRIKVMATADIAEKRRHQDGRILFESRLHGINLDMRVSFFITIHGEKVVLRLLNNKGTLLDIKEIGMAPRMLKHFIYEALDTPGEDPKDLPRQLSLLRRPRLIKRQKRGRSCMKNKINEGGLNQLSPPLHDGRCREIF